MAHLQYFNDSDAGLAKERYGYSQAVRIGNTIECSGQGGRNRATNTHPTNLRDEIEQAFKNVETVLKSAGATGWAQVYKVRSYHCPPFDQEVLKIMVAGLKRWCPGHAPLWTCVGVEGLALEEMRVEIEVVACMDS